MPAVDRMSSPSDVDVVLLGSATPTSLAAAALAQAGLSTVLVQTPPVDIPEGTTTVPFTSELFELLADRLGLPEVRQLALFGTAPEEVRATSARKQCLSFAHHDGIGLEQNLQFVVPSEHEEWHFDRRALDAWCLRLARNHGAQVIPADTRPRITFLTEERLWVTDHAAVPRARFLLDGSGRASSADLEILGARRMVTDKTWQSVQLICRTKPGTGRTPAVPHALPWEAGTSLLATRDGTCQMATVPGRDGAFGRTTVWMTIVAGSDQDPLEVLSDRFGRLDAVADFLGRLQAVEHVAVSDAFTRVKSSGNLPAMVLDRTVELGPHLLSRDLTCSLEVLVTVLPGLVHVLNSSGTSPMDVSALVRQQTAVVDLHHRWAHAALLCADSWPRWNAFLRVWLLWTIMGALSIKRERIAGTQHGWDALDRRGGSWWYAPPVGIVEIINEALPLLMESDPAPGDADRVFARLRKDPIVPPLFDFGDPAARSYRLTATRRLRMLVWALVTGRRARARLLTSDNITGRVRAGS